MPINIYVKDAMRAEIEAMSGGNNTIMYDAAGYPSTMVWIPAFNVETIDASLGTGLHPAFTVNGVAKTGIWIGKYQASLLDGKAVSMPGVIPAVNVNRDAAQTYCAAKGAGWHLMTNAEWAAIALWCWKNNCQPSGNMNWGKSSDNVNERGIRADGVAVGTASGDGKTYCGSGPVSWNHDNSPWGIADLCGNVWEWVGGMRINDGEIQVIADNDAADNTKDQAAGSALWRAVAGADGSLVAPGTAGSLKYDATAASSGSPQIDDVIDFQTTGVSCGFASLAADAGITIPARLKALCLAPIAASGLGSDSFYVNNTGERLPSRGGSWYDGSVAGVFDLYLTFARSVASANIGFRPAFVS